MPCQCTLLTREERFTAPLAKPHYPPRLPLLPTHISLSASFDIPKALVTAKLTQRLRAQWPGANSITLNAEDFASLTITSPDDECLQHSYDGHLANAVFGIPLQKGDEVTIVIEYTIDHPIDGLLFSKENDGVFVVSDHETERARYWLPVVDHPSVRTPISFKLRTATDLTALANGQLVEEKVDGDHKITTWEMRQPTPSYLICVAIGRFLRASGGSHNGKPIDFFAPTGGRFRYTEEDLALSFGRTKEMIEFMEKKVQFELPWPKYYQFACGEVGGAMENSSLVSYDEWYMLDERSSVERAHRVDSTVVHELAHTWFGDMVVCADFCYSFLKESFATLISAEWYNYKHGNDEFQNTLTRYAEVSFSETAEYMRPIVTRKYDSSWSLFDRHLYTNGAWRLHMLRMKLGDTVFWEAVSAYLHKRAWKTVEADDFRRDLEDYSGEPLSAYFEQWFYGKGHPVLEASFSYDASKGGFATVAVKQTQPDEKKGVGVFDITIDFAIEVSAGDWETHTITMENGATSSQFVQKLHARPLQVILDPEKKVLHKLSKFSGVGDDMCIRSLLHAPTFAGRHQAARLLHESGSRRARAALREAIRKEKHWGLRGMIVQMLGGGARVDSLPALIDALQHEPDARVTPLILNAIGEFRHPDAEKTLLKFATEGHDMMRPYGAIGAAIRGLGRTRNIEHLELISGFLEDPRKRGNSFEIPLSAALALGHLRDWEAVGVLMRNGNPPNTELTPRVRCTVMNAIENGVSWEGRVNRSKVFEFLEKVVRSGDVKSVRLAAASALAGLADVGNPSSTLTELEKQIENQSKGRIRTLRRKARRSASGKDGSSKASNVAIEKLQSEVKELKAKLDDIQAELEVRGKDGDRDKGAVAKADGRTVVD